DFLAGRMGLRSEGRAYGIRVPVVREPPSTHGEFEMNDVGSNVVEREDIPLHPSLVSFLHPAPPVAAMPGVAELAEQDDKIEGTPHDATSIELDDSAMQVLFVSPPSEFAATVVD